MNEAEKRAPSDADKEQLFMNMLELLSSNQKRAYDFWQWFMQAILLWDALKRFKLIFLCLLCFIPSPKHWHVGNILPIFYCFYLFLCCKTPIKTELKKIFNLYRSTIKRQKTCRKVLILFIYWRKIWFQCDCKKN